MGDQARKAIAALPDWLRSELDEPGAASSFDLDEAHEAGSRVVLIGNLVRHGTPARVGLRFDVRGEAVSAGSVHADPAEALRHAELDRLTAPDVALVRRHYDAFNRDDLDGVARTLHSRIELFGGDELGGAGERYSGRDDAMKFFAEVKRLVAENKVQVLSLEAEPGRVESSVRMQGTLRRSGVSGQLPGVHFFTIHDGLIARIETFRPNWRAAI